ncbi:MAG: capsular biosynthesis protein [Bacteroidetes bacterium]|nr:capsular biosynthesis protein [Bacteroidota bacterium]
MHSHILPGLDDGSGNPDQSIEMIKVLIGLGFKKLITTPHIMGDFYKNTPEIILSKLNELKEIIKERKIDIVLETAAEYYLDEWFIEKLKNEEKLLTFGDNYLLFEMSYLNEPIMLNEAIFLMRSAGYKPIIAHPERYTYLYSDFQKYKNLYEQEILIQLNTISLSGYYSKMAKKIAHKLIDNNMIHFVGSDLHSVKQAAPLISAMKTKYYRKALGLDLMNNGL